MWYISLLLCPGPFSTLGQPLQGPFCSSLYFQCSAYHRVGAQWMYVTWINDGKKLLPKFFSPVFSLPLTSDIYFPSFSSSCIVAKSCPTLATSWTEACQAPLSMGFSRQEYWSGLSFPSPGESSRPMDQTHIYCIGRWILYPWATCEALPLLLATPQCPPLSFISCGRGLWTRNPCLTTPGPSDPAFVTYWLCLLARCLILLSFGDLNYQTHTGRNSAIMWLLRGLSEIINVKLSTQWVTLQISSNGEMNYCNNNSFLLIGTSLVVQWLRIHAPNVGSLGSLPAQAIRSHMP